uniref:Uncharacterized protein n=1 Tax=Ceratitis capitata TaxID=7213 RepID=W8C6S0_CERCA
MLLHRLHAVIWFLSGVIGLYAYPTINIPFLFGTSAYGEGAHRFKKSGLEIQSDADVVELEHLRDHYGNENPDATDQMPAQFEQPPFGPDIGVGKTVSAEPLSESQELERQLEQMPAITTKLEKIATTTTELAPAPAVAVPENRGDQQSVVEGGGMHRPPTLQHDNGGKTLAEGGGSAGQQQAAEFGAIVPAGGSPPAPSAIKPFYGAARLAFGQNPEVLPTTTTTTTTKASTAVTSTSTTSVMPITTTTTTTTSTTPKPPTNNSTERPKNTGTPNKTTTSAESVNASTSAAATSDNNNAVKVQTTKAPSSTKKKSTFETSLAALLFGDDEEFEEDVGGEARKQQQQSQQPLSATVETKTVSAGPRTGAGAPRMGPRSLKIR